MWVKVLCVASLVSVVCCGSVSSYRGLGKGRGYLEEDFRSPYYEVPCMEYGGICLQKSECPKGKESGVRGLCPMQQEKGVECCFAVAKSSTTCRANGGECMDASTNCPPNLTFLKASDCQQDKKCCILVN